MAAHSHPFSGKFTTRINLFTQIALKGFCILLETFCMDVGEYWDIGAGQYFGKYLYA